MTIFRGGTLGADVESELFDLSSSSSGSDAIVDKALDVVALAVPLGFGLFAVKEEFGLLRSIEVFTP